MVFDDIQKLQAELTDKFVTVDGSRPELARFGGLVGVVKTVNFSGRALVQFDEWINNIGWFDIDTSFLKLASPDEVARIAAKKEEPKARKKEAPAEAAAPAKAAKAAAGEKKPGLSVAEMMAAARGSAGAAPAAKKADEPAKAKDAPAAGGAKQGALSVAEMMAAARASAGGAPATPATKPEAAPAAKLVAKSEAPAKATDAKGLTVEQMLKLAREQASSKAAAAAAAPVAEAAPTPVKAPAAAKAEAAPAAPVAKPAGKGGALPKDIPGILAFCRQADAK